MARRRPPKRPPRTSSKPSRSGTPLLWIPVILLAGFSIWLWYRAMNPVDSGSGADPALAEASEPSGAFVPTPAPAPPVFDLPPFPAQPEPPVIRLPEPTPVVGGAASTVVPSTATSGPVATGPGSVGVPAPPPAAVQDPRSRLSTEKMVAVQLALARRGISSGSIDGVAGAQTRAALRIFQKSEGLPASGEPDPATVQRLGVGGAAYGTYTVTAEDLASLTSVPRSWMEKSRKARLGYESVLELVAERSHAHPRLIRGLNPDVDWGKVYPGKVVRVPALVPPEPKGKPAFIRISLSEKTLRVFDVRTNLLVHFPCSIAAKVEKRPQGVLRVARIAPQPNYRFDPDIFPESAEARRIGKKLMIPPGPNNPVGTAWIGLDRPGYGIHGTPNPEEVGRTESHGCFRLANWNAELLVKLVWIGMPVHVEP